MTKGHSQRLGHGLLSVAMCTWNGAAYLEEQLDSIRRQTRQPDELVVCDDGSTDSTMQLLEGFRRESPFPVKISRNKVRLGPAKNFEKAISLCSGQIVSLSDQDDVWLPHKLERLKSILVANPDAGYAFSDASVVGEDLSPMRYGMWERVGFGWREQKAFLRGEQVGVLLKRDRVSGTAMAFRSAYRDLILPIPESWFHDAWIATVLSCAGHGGCLVRESLLLYRQHPGQASGGRKASLGHKLLRLLMNQETSLDQRAYTDLLERLVALGAAERDVLKRVAMKGKHVDARLRACRASALVRLGTVAKEAVSGRYCKYSNGWRSIARDLVGWGRTKHQASAGS